MDTFYQEKLIAKTASLYYQKHLNQKQISEKLRISQPTVSRLLGKALKHNIVKVSVNNLPGLHSNLENEICKKFNLKDCVISKDSSKNNQILQNEIGNAAAFYLETILSNNEIIGISSWSQTLLNAINAMHPINNLNNVKVVQTLGGVGDSSATEHAVRLLSRMAELTNAEKYYLPISGIVSKNFDIVSLNDQYINVALNLFNQLNIALVGIGAIDNFSSLIKNSGNVFPNKEINRLVKKGAVGDMGLQFFDIKGNEIAISNNYSVIGLKLDQLKKTNNVIAIAGGLHKVKAIVGALNTSVINTLITDPFTARDIMKNDK
tara:strand:- start:1318 stop:2277 length:960 start_codon:yes stop_codon:yes gene_type:complete